MGRDLLTVPAAGLTGPTGVCLARADAALRDAGLEYGDVADEELREADLWLLHGHKKKSRRVQPQSRSFNFHEGRLCVAGCVIRGSACTILSFGTTIA